MTRDVKRGSAVSFPVPRINLFVAGLVGWHVAKRGDRYAAVQAVGMAVRNVFGHLSPSAARGLALRHDHGGAFLAEHFHHQICFWGMTPSYAFVGEPETTDEIEQPFFRLACYLLPAHGRPRGEEQGLR